MDLQVLCFEIFFFFCVVYPGAALQPLKHQSQCQRQCGDQIVPYPFGLENSVGCLLDPSYLLTCNYSFTPPTLFLLYNVEILNLSVETATAIAYISTTYACYNEFGFSDGTYYSEDLTESPFTFSSTHNTFMGIGCDTKAYLYLEEDEDHLVANCSSTCDSNTSIKNRIQITQEVKPCSDVGCCKTQIPEGLKHVGIRLRSPNNHSNVFASNPCDYAFLTGPNAKLVRSTAIDTIKSEVVLDWAVEDTTCEERKINICGPNTNCQNYNNGPGYRCFCNQGYTGNPYDTVQGCQGTKTAGNGNTNTAVSSATADTMQGSYIGYMVLLLLGFVEAWY